MIHSFPPRRSSDLSFTNILRGARPIAGLPCGFEFCEAGEIVLRRRACGQAVGMSERGGDVFAFGEFAGDEPDAQRRHSRSEEHTSELQSLMRISYAVFCLKKKKHKQHYEPTKYK